MIRIGDEFLGFVLERIEVTPEMPHQPISVIGHFAGEVTIAGSLQAQHGCSTRPEIHAFDFALHRDYLSVLPQFYPSFGRTDAFLLYGVSDISRLLGFNKREVSAIENGAIRNMRVDNLAIRVGNFSVSSRNPRGHFEILEVISFDNPTYTRHFQAESILWSVSIIFVFFVAVGLCVGKIYTRYFDGCKAERGAE